MEVVSKRKKRLIAFNRENSQFMRFFSRHTKKLDWYSKLNSSELELKQHMCKICIPILTCCPLKSKEYFQAAYMLLITDNLSFIQFDAL